MARRARRLAESGIYHVMLRGVNREAVFRADSDRERFLEILSCTQELSQCVVLAYCLMTNHVHIVLRTHGEPIGDVLKRLGVRYAMWFNRKYSRVGHLFQDRFKSVVVETDAHLLVLVRYVWNNPVKAGLVSLPEDYRWSSRRFLESGAGLADASALRGLLPPDALTDPWLQEAPPADDLMLVRIGVQDRLTDVDAERLLRRVCGVTSGREFVGLDIDVQRRTVRELRDRSVTFAQIARATGKPASSIRRLAVQGGQDGLGRPTSRTDAARGR